MENKLHVSDKITMIEGDDFQMCMEYRSVKIQGKEIALTAKEFDIFALLILNPKRVFTYEMIIDLIWKDPYEAYPPKITRNHISNLKKKLGTNSIASQQIKSVYGVGYKFDGNVQISYSSP